MEHHAYVVAGEHAAALEQTTDFLESTYGLSSKANPDFIVRNYGLFSVEDARALTALALLAPVTGETKALILVVERIYREAQNALLKLLEEPPAGTVIMLLVPHEAMLLPTVRSRVVVLQQGSKDSVKEHDVSREAKEFLDASPKTRTAIIKKLTSGKDEDARRALRDTALLIMDGVEVHIYSVYQKEKNSTKRIALRAVLSDLEVLRGYMYDRAAPVRMIMEHLSLVLPDV